MDPRFLKLMKDKKDAGHEMDPLEHSAKLENLKGLKSAMHGMMKDDLLPGKDVKEVKVASDSKEGLSSGLDKAKELLGKEDESEDHFEDGDHGDMEEGDSEESESPMDELEEATKDATPEELDAMIQKLEELKRSKE